MPRSKATAKLEPQTHASDERGGLYRDQDSYRKKKRKDFYEFSKKKTNNSLLQHLVFSPTQFVITNTYAPVTTSTNLMISALFFAHQILKIILAIA